MYFFVTKISGYDSSSITVDNAFISPNTEASTNTNQLKRLNESLLSKKDRSDDMIGASNSVIVEDGAQIKKIKTEKMLLLLLLYIATTLK